MEAFKKICKALLLPHIAIMIILVPVATVLLVWAMLTFEADGIIAVTSYVLAAYTLTVWCIRAPMIIGFLRSFKRENKYAKRWFEDVHFRTGLTLYGSLLWNTAYAVLQLGLGIAHSTFWFYSLAAYYFCLALMRVFLALHIRKHNAHEDMLEQLKKYRICGWIFLVMNMALTLIIFFMVYWNRTFIHHEITTIAIAAYTFTTFTFAIVNIVKYRKYNSPVYSASKAISLAAACVSMLTLTCTMFATFGENDITYDRLMLSLVGGAVSVFIVSMAIYMIVQSTKKIRVLRSEDKNE